MEKFKNSVLGQRLNYTIQCFRDSIVCDYDVSHIGDAYYLTLFCGYFVPETLITAIIHLGFTFNSVSIESHVDAKLKVLFYIEDKVI